MTKTMTPRELSNYFKALRRGGIPLDDVVVQSMKAASRGLSLHQTGTPVDSNIFDLNSGGAGYILSIAICNDSDRIIRPVACRLKTPWDEARLRWLEDPLRRVPREYSYSFPAADLYGFEREGVLNHLLNRKIRLYPGDMIEGFLLGVGEECISADYRDRRCLVTQFSVYDARGNRSDVHVSFRLGAFGPPGRRRSFSGSASKSRIPVETRSEESCEGEEFAA
jgi:hypothetical protein